MALIRCSSSAGGGSAIKHLTGTVSLTKNVRYTVSPTNCTHILGCYVYRTSGSSKRGAGIRLEDGTYERSNYANESYPTMPLADMTDTSVVFLWDSSTDFTYDIMYE